MDEVVDSGQVGVGPVGQALNVGFGDDSPRTVGEHVHRGRLVPGQRLPGGGRFLQPVGQVVQPRIVGAVRDAVLDIGGRHVAECPVIDAVIGVGDVDPVVPEHRVDRAIHAGKVGAVSVTDVNQRLDDV